MDTPKPTPTDTAAVVADTATPVEKTQGELFNEELLVLLNKYPTVRLTVNHQISINDIGTKPEGVKVG